MPSSWRTGPLNTSSGAEAARKFSPLPDAVMAWSEARTAAKYSGRQPAITALAAICPVVAGVPTFPRLYIAPGTSPPSVTYTWLGSRPPSMASTRSGVGGTTGSPSDQPLSRSASHTTSKLLPSTVSSTVFIAPVTELLTDGRGQCRHDLLVLLLGEDA